jgi:hypothetical protein
VAASNNDINVLNQLPLFTAQRQGIASEVHFTVNGNEYDMGYYLVDGIYREWAAFVKSYKSLNVRSISYLLSINNQEEKILSVHLVCCNLILPFYVPQHICGKQGLLVRSCMLAL